MASSGQQKQVSDSASVPSTHMPRSRSATPIDWKTRFEVVQAEHQLERERIRHYYEQQLQERVAEVKAQLQREYEQQMIDFRARLVEQQPHNLSSSSLGLEQSIGDQVREQVRLAQEYDRVDDERRQTLLKHATDSHELQEIVQKLHNEGVHVLTLSELLALRLNGIDINTTGDSVDSLQKLLEENAHLRSLIAKMTGNATTDDLIRNLANVFRCEQERRLVQVRQHPNFDLLEQEIHEMCDFQREALTKLLSEDRPSATIDPEQSKRGSQHSRTNKYHLKYLRCENYRKALIYQKRYLLILLAGYADTEAYALKEIRRLTGHIPTNSSLDRFNGNKKQSILKQPYHRRLFDYRFRFRYHVRVVIAVVRMRCFVRKWTKTVTSIQ